MEVKPAAGWLEILKEEFASPYFQALKEFLHTEKTSGRQIFPSGNRIFAALDQTPFERVKVVIIGQDPYHGPGQANGLCFSVFPGINHPPSLVNIFKEIKSDLGNPYPLSGNLEPWADQGVLLLNATLTVRHGEAGSHQNKGWEKFTDSIIQHLNKEKSGLVFMLWGAYARAKGKNIDRSRHLVLECGHPSPLSANKGHWFGNRHFSQCNAYLVSKGINPIDWQIR